MKRESQEFWGKRGQGRGGGLIQEVVLKKKKRPGSGKTRGGRNGQLFEETGRKCTKSEGENVIRGQAKPKAKRRGDEGDFW